MKFGRLGRVLATAAVLTLFGAGTAHAGSVYQFDDGFEGDPASRFVADHDGSAATGYDLGQGTARSGANNGWLFASNGWAGEGVWHNVESWPVGWRCFAAFYAQPIGGGAQVGIEVRDPIGRLITSAAPWLPGSGYQQVATGQFSVDGAGWVELRAVYGNSSGSPRTIRIDDFVLQCAP